MEASSWKRGLQDVVRGIEGLLEKGLGERAKVEEQVRHFAKNLESAVSEAVWGQSVPRRLNVKVQKLHHFKGQLPTYQTPMAAGFDVCAQLGASIVIEPGQRHLIPTALAFEIPPGFELQVRARSGWAIKTGMGLVNAPGTIDADYRGEVKIILINWGQEPVTVHDQDRIAQLVLSPVLQANLEAVEELATSARGEGGFGSTGHN